VVRRAIELQSASIVLVHNHPNRVFSIPEIPV
jgi:DNA repair protein RadC